VNVLDIFSGIGGFSLGLERAGMRTVAFCEQEPYCRAVLRRHWPNVPIYQDVRELTAARLSADGIRVDAICGGFPCQDISQAGRGAGIAGRRSGLWSEYRRLIGECGPAWAIIENSPALRSRGLDQVLRELSALGYDAEWHCIPASAIGAPHQRDRIWIMAYPSGRTGGQEGPYLSWPCNWFLAPAPFKRGAWGPRGGGGAPGGCWGPEPDVGRVANGVPARVDRLRALGNAAVPQIPEMIGRAILYAEQQAKFSMQPPSADVPIRGEGPAASASSSVVGGRAE